MCAQPLGQKAHKIVWGITMVIDPPRQISTHLHLYDIYPKYHAFNCLFSANIDSPSCLPHSTYLVLRQVKIRDDMVAFFCVT